MPMKGWLYAQLEVIQSWMEKDPTMEILWEYETMVADRPDGKRIRIGGDLAAPMYVGNTTLSTGWSYDDKFSRKNSWRTPGPWGEPIDEMWMTSSCIGAAQVGARAVAKIPNLVTCYAFEQVLRNAGKTRHCANTNQPVRFVCWLGSTGRIAVDAQHHDGGEESVFAFIPGVVTVVPSTVYDAKGLLNAALAGDDPVVYVDYMMMAYLPPEDVPDEDYSVPIGKAAVRQEGTDLTLAYWGDAVTYVTKALPLLKAAGISVEAIDIRSIKPFDEDTLIKSVTKTKRLHVVSTGYWACNFAHQVASTAAQNVSGAKFKVQTAPDIVVSGPAVYNTWATPTDDKIVAAAKKLVG